MKNLLLLLLLLFLPFYTFSQTECIEKLTDSTVSIKSLKKTYKKAGPKNYFEAANVAMDLGFRLTLQKDTNAGYWLKQAIENYKKTYTKTDHYKGELKKILHKCAVCYYLLDDYQTAITWLNKAEKAKCDEVCLYYFRGECEVNLQQCGDAKKDFRIYTDSTKVNVSSLFKPCEIK